MREIIQSKNIDFNEVLSQELDEYIALTDELMEEIRLGQLMESENVDKYYDQAFTRAFVKNGAVERSNRYGEIRELVREASLEIGLNLSGISEVPTFLSRLWSRRRYSIRFKLIGVLVAVQRNSGDNYLYIKNLYVRSAHKESMDLAGESTRN